MELRELNLKNLKEDIDNNFSGSKKKYKIKKRKGTNLEDSYELILNEEVEYPDDFYSDNSNYSANNIDSVVPITLYPNDIFNGNKYNIIINTNKKYNGILFSKKKINSEIENSSSQYSIIKYIFNVTIQNDNTIENEYYNEEYGGGIMYNESEYFKITNCYTSLEINNLYGGGICGANSNNFIVEQCYSTGNMFGKFSGGICGYKSNNFEIINCYSTGDIYGDESGGIGGSNLNNFKISNCYSTGDIYGDFSGGICGYKSNNFKIINCYTIGKIIGLYSGGICGGTDSDTITEDKPNEIVNCYSTGSIGIYNYSPYKEFYAGGIMGVKCNNYILNNCYSSGNKTQYSSGICGFENNNFTAINCCYMPDITDNIDNIDDNDNHNYGIYNIGDITNTSIKLTNCSVPNGYYAYKQNDPPINTNNQTNYKILDFTELAKYFETNTNKKNKKNIFYLPSDTKYPILNSFKYFPWSSYIMYKSTPLLTLKKNKLNYELWLLYNKR